MSDSTANKRIAKNSLYLYIRMGIMMLVTFYTSRVVLGVLGVDRFGTWNIINSFVVSFSFISAPLVTSTQRYLNYDMGKGGSNLNKIFNTSIVIFLALCAILILLFESIGLWFLNNKLNFGSESLSVANTLYQLMIATFIVKIMRLPYEATIIAHEKMSFYAIICLLETFLLLAIVYLLKLFPTNRMLICYGAFTLISHSCITLGYIIYCRRNFSCVSINFKIEKPLLKEMSSFSGWNLLVAFSSMTATTGLNVVANLFFGVVVNAAYGITGQISAAVNQFIMNFQRAVNPQIVQNVANKNYDRVRSLIYNSSKFSFFVTFILAFPMFINMDTILSLWLGANVPEYTSTFCKINLYYLLVVCCANIFDYTILALGNIRNYQLVISALIFLNIVIIYIAYSLGAPPQSLYIIKAAVEVVIFIVRLSILGYKRVITFTSFVKRALVPCALSALISVGLYYVVTFCFNIGTGVSHLLYSLLIFTPIYIVISYLIVLTKEQRSVIASKVSSLR